MSLLDERWIKDGDTVISFEQKYQLPKLSGSIKQVTWGRLIRWRALDSAFANIDTTLLYKPTIRGSIYDMLNLCRKVSAADVWIGLFVQTAGIAETDLIYICEQLATGQFKYGPFKRFRKRTTKKKSPDMTESGGLFPDLSATDKGETSGNTQTTHGDGQEHLQRDGIDPAAAGPGNA